jgi:hypothetical protein
VGVSVPSFRCTWSDIAGALENPGEAVPATTPDVLVNPLHGALTLVAFAPPYPIVMLLVLADEAKREIIR